MGLFSFLSKNKQDSAPDDGAFYANADDAAVTARAKSKRASSNGEPAPRRGRNAVDPILPEKKRARRRLVGAVALALAVAVGLPMVLDSEPKPLASDIAIQIPSKDKLSFTPSLSQAAVNSEAVKVAARETQEQLEKEMAAKAGADQAAADKAAAAKPAAEAAPAGKGSDKAPDKGLDKNLTITEVKADSKDTPKPESKPAKPAPKSDDKPLAAKPAEGGDDARAMAILEGKGEAVAAKFMVQVAALSTPEKIAELQDKLKAAGMKPSTQKVPTESGERTRIRVGPYGKDEAEKVRARLIKMGLNGTLVPA
jgi:DedD protein